MSTCRKCGALYLFDGMCAAAAASCENSIHSPRGPARAARLARRYGRSQATAAAAVGRASAIALADGVGATETKACPASSAAASSSTPAAATAGAAGNGCIRGEAHRPNKHRCSLPEYWLFGAASDGCLPCVQRMVHDEGVDARSTSMHMKYTALDFANWATERGVAGAREVAAYLAQEAFLAQETEAHSLSEWSGVADCIPGLSHSPTKRRRALRKYWLFGAARAGCMRCVTPFIEVEGVDPTIRQTRMHGQRWILRPGPASKALSEQRRWKRI